ncbi:MAG: FHA domain-containing protein [Planctomycetaceae bacterium]
MTLQIHRVGPLSELLEVIPLAAWHSLHFGTAAGADVQLTPHPALPQVCLRVWQDTDRFLAESLTGSRRIVVLNGQPLDSIIELERGDTIEIGIDRFVVTTEQQLRVEVRDVAAAPESAEDSVIRQVLISADVNGCLRRYVPADPAWSAAGVVQKLCDRHGAFLFANFLYAGLTGRPPDFAGEDLYSHAPDEVRDVYSLHAVSKASTAQKLQIFEALRTSDAVICAVAEADFESCLKNAKICLAWFARPSVMEMTLTKGSRHLAEKLMAPFRALMFAPHGGQHEWVMFTKADVDIDEFGLSDSAA